MHRSRCLQDSPITFDRRVASGSIQPKEVQAPFLDQSFFGSLNLIIRVQ